MVVNKKTLLMTGGAKRVGREVIKHFAQKNWQIAFTYFSSQTEAFQLEKEIKPFAKIKSYQGDLKNLSFCQNLIKEVKKDFGDIELLINNASIFTQDSFLDCKIEKLDEYLAIHLKAPLILMQQYAKLIKKGNIINITDYMIQYEGSNNFFSYVLTKKNLEILTEMAKFSFADEIKVNSIKPRKLMLDKKEIRNKKIELENIQDFFLQIDECLL